MNAPFLLSLAATAIEMTVCLMCTRLLWRLRSSSWDISRRLLALGSLSSGLLAAFVLMVNLGAGSSAMELLMLRPGVSIVYMSMHIIMTLYPITVVRPDWLNPKRYFLLFLPVAVFFILFLFFAGRWTPLYSTRDIWDNITKPDVIVRLGTLVVMLPYCLILFALPYNRRQSSASFWWILNYSFGLAVICVVHIILMLTYNTWIIIALPLLASVFYLFSTEYELGDRLRPGLAASTASEDDHAPIAAGVDGVPAEFGLWTRVGVIMNEEEAWRDPDFNLIGLARMCGTNVTYLNRIIRQETGGGFKELLNRKRIFTVVAQLRDNPGIDIQDAFFNAGYRSRATAWRNFKDIMGVTPTEYRQSLK